MPGCGVVATMFERSKMAQRLLAHATLCQHAASFSWDEAIAVELEKLADGCRQAAAACEPALAPTACRPVEELGPPRKWLARPASARGTFL